MGAAERLESPDATNVAKRRLGIPGTVAVAEQPIRQDIRQDNCVSLFVQHLLLASLEPHGMHAVKADAAGRCSKATPEHRTYLFTYSA